jgi:hypothetical protein
MPGDRLSDNHHPAGRRSGRVANFRRSRGEGQDVANAAVFSRLGLVDFPVSRLGRLVGGRLSVPPRSEGVCRGAERGLDVVVEMEDVLRVVGVLHGGQPGELVR